MGKTIWENPIETWLGENSQIGECLFVPSWKKIILFCVCGWHKNWQERNKILIRCGKYSIKKLIWENSTSFQDHVYLGYTQRQCQITKDIVDNYRTMFESRISTWGAEKLPFPQNLRISSWSYDMAGTCKEMCGTTLWVGKQDYTTTLQSIYSMHRWPPLQRRRNEICWRIATSMLSNCSEMLILDTYWRPDILWSMNKLARSITKWDQGLWQTSESIDFIHSSYMWI